MAFPPVRTLIMSTPQRFSTEALSTITASLGSLYSASNYPLTNLTDGKAQAMCRFATLSAGILLTFTGPQDLKVLGLFNHNLDPQLLIEVKLDGLLLPRTFSVQYPNCWIDLRAFSGDLEDPDATVSATTVEVLIHGNSRPVALSEVVVGDAYTFDGTIELPFPEIYGSVASRQYTDGFTTLEWGPGTHLRALTLQLQVSAASYAEILTIAAATATTELVTVVPSSRRNDIWLVRWPTLIPATFPQSDQLVTVPLELVEEAMGILV